MADMKIIDEEYATGSYTMAWLDKYDECHIASFDTKEEMRLSYDDEWEDGGWDFEFYAPDGERITI